MRRPSRGAQYLVLILMLLVIGALQTHLATQSVVHSDRIACLRSEDNRLALVVAQAAQAKANLAEATVFDLVKGAAAKKLVAPLIADRRAEAAASRHLAVLYAKQLAPEQAPKLPKDLRRYAHFSCTAAFPDSPIW